jgi:S1-C subfamily serine protease
LSWFRLLGLVVLAALVAAGVSVAVVNLMRRDTVQPVARGQLPQGGQANGPQAAAQRAADSVVRIQTGPSPSPATGQVPASPPGGSGAIVDSRGYILTAQAVVAGAAGLIVSIPGGKAQSARVIGSDPEWGLTLLKVDASNLKALQVFGGSTMETGSGVAVMAAPPWFQMAVGAVATAHTTTNIDDPANPGGNRALNDVVALDVAPRDGQLGAPILDGGGRLIGMVIAAGPQVYGIDMADAQPSVQQLIDNGHVSHPWLGFEYRQLAGPEAADRGVPAGVEVLTVQPGSAAAQAGVTPGEIVVSANGTNLDATHPLSRLLRGMAVGQSVSLSVKTPSARKSISLTVALLSP